MLELALCLHGFSEGHQGPTKCDMRGKIQGPMHQPHAAHADGFVKLAASARFLGELQKRKRRRILSDPASKVFQSGIADRHANDLIVSRLERLLRCGDCDCTRRRAGAAVTVCHREPDDKRPH